MITFGLLFPFIGNMVFLSVKKKLIKPWAVNNNELADFISRVPDNEELVSCLTVFFDLNNS